MAVLLLLKSGYYAQLNADSLHFLQILTESLYKSLGKDLKIVFRVLIFRVLL
jgi:hypothetical protein